MRHFSRRFGCLSQVEAPALAQSETLAVDGHVAHAAQLTPGPGQGSAAGHHVLTFQSIMGRRPDTYTGALLLDIVNQAAPVDQGSDKGAPWSTPSMATRP